VEQSAKNRLSSLSGFPVRGDGLQGLATGNRTGKPAERKQEILTPPEIVNVCKVMWADQISLDPCWCEGSITDPLDRYEYPKQDGLKLPWCGYSYINPPYRDLKDWLEYGPTQPAPQIWLVPVRTHRRWWRHWRDYCTDAYCELDPVKFIGYDQFFPAPLLLGYRGDIPSKFMEVARRLGSVYYSQ